MIMEVISATCKTSEVFITGKYFLKFSGKNSTFIVIK